MRCFRLKTPALVLLIGLLAVITLILILPNVDLLDAAFHRNTSPLGLHAYFHSLPHLNVSSTLVSLVLVLAGSRRFESRDLTSLAFVEPLRILHHSLRC
jgi:hypothetical protein